MGKFLERDLPKRGLLLIITKPDTLNRVAISNLMKSLSKLWPKLIELCYLIMRIPKVKKYKSNSFEQCLQYILRSLYDTIISETSYDVIKPTLNGSNSLSVCQFRPRKYSFFPWPQQATSHFLLCGIIKSSKEFCVLFC